MNDRKIINVHVVVSRTTIDYFAYQFENYRHCASDSSRLFFFCYALDPKTFEVLANDSRLSVVDPVYAYSSSYRKNTLQEWKVFLKARLTGRALLAGSNGHAAGLNRAAHVMKQCSGIHLISDVDAFMVQHGWDDTVVRLMEDYDLVGAPYEDPGGFSSGKSKVQTFKRFPSAVWIALSDRHDWSDVDWWPSKESNVPIENQDLATLYNLEVGNELVRDVGWQLPGYAATRGYHHFALDHVKPSSPKIDAIRTGRDYNEEYQLDGKAFVAHQRGSSRHSFKACEISTAFFECLEARVGLPLGHGDEKGSAALTPALQRSDS